MTEAQHQASIIEQFTRQAGPFTGMPGHSQESAFRLMLESTGALRLCIWSSKEFENERYSQWR